MAYQCPEKKALVASLQSSSQDKPMEMPKVEEVLTNSSESENE